MTLQIKIDGEIVDTCSLDEFVASNETLADEEIDALAALAVGETYVGGGGAASVWSATRVASEAARRIPRPDSLTAVLDANEWHTPLGLCSKAVWDVEEDTKALLAVDNDPLLRHEVAPKAARSLIKARNWLSEAASMIEPKDYVYLVSQCDKFAAAQRLCLVKRMAA